MRSKYKVLFPLFAFILTASLSYGKTFGPKAPDHRTKISFKCITTDNTHDTYTPILNPLESVPIITLQTHKVVKIAQAVFNSLSETGYCLKCYNFFSGSGNHPPACSKKPLLFPFHTFW